MGPSTPTRVEYPPYAKPGHCYQKVFVPDLWQPYTEQVIDQPGRTDLRVIPGVFGDETRQVVVREESVEFVTIPATYRTVTETIVVNPPSTRIEVVPPVYETVTEKVLVRESYTAWKPGKPPVGSQYNPDHVKVLPTGDVLCLVEVPAEYKIITRQVVKVPGRSVEVPVPPETKVITRQVVDQPARVDRRVIPAQFATVQVRVVRQPPRTESFQVPPTYKTITKSKMTRPSGFEWQEIECEPAYAQPTGKVYDEAPPPVYSRPVPQPQPQQPYRPAPAYPAPQPAYPAPQPPCDRCDGEYGAVTGYRAPAAISQSATAVRR